MTGWYGVAISWAMSESATTNAATGERSDARPRRARRAPNADFRRAKLTRKPSDTH
jgi:hypothetical protein